MPPNFIDPIEWYRRDFLDARIRGDEKRQELAQLFDLFAQNQRLDRNLALNYLEEGQNLAQEIKQPYWELLFDYWYYSMSAGGIGNVDAIVRLFLKANKESYRECPILGRIYTAMVEAYVWEDPISYAQEIRQAIEYTQEQVPLSEESYQRIMVAKLRLHHELQEYEAIEQTSRTAMVYNEKYPQDLFNAYIYVAQARAALGNYQKALDSAILAEKLGQWQKSLDLQRTALMVQAMIQARQGNAAAADVLRFQMKELDWQGAKWLDLSFDAELEYWRHTSGLFGKLMVARFAKDVLSYYKKQGQAYWECRSRLNLIRALMDLPFLLRWLAVLVLALPPMKEQVLEAMDAANRLKKSDWYLDKLSAVAAKYMP